MGAKDSKLAFLTYEEACKRVTDAELKRLKDSFKRYAGANNYMNRNTFIKEVLGDGVPPKLAELLFMACSGNQKGIGFKELVCGLVLLTRGRQDEKLKFLFSLYCNPGSNLIQKTDMDARILDTEGHLPQSLSLLFKDSDQITYECFQKWVLQNQEVTSLTKWLLKEPSVVSLSNNLETPTFYQTLAGVTHLEEPDIIELETRYWQLKSQSKTGRFDMETFQTAVCPPVPHTLSQGLFAAFDENFDGHIDFKEMACGISACCRGPFTERLKFCFKVFDKDHDGLLSRTELVDMVAALLVIHHDNKCALGEVIDASENITPESMAETIINKHDSDGDECITQEEFLVWAISQALPTVFTTVLFQVCHIVLGLKPQNKKDEGLIVKGWLKREEQHGLAVGQTWYLVAMQWWQQWQAYVHCQNTPQAVFDETGNSMGLNTSPSPDPGGGCGHISNGKKSHNRTGSLNLCPGLSWRSSITFDESVPLATYQIGELTINSDHSQEASPLKSATLPRSSPRPTANNSNNSSMNNSPRATKKLDGVIPVEIAKPGPIENSPLTTTTLYKVPTLTNEGAHLRRDKTLVRGRDFELVSEPVWKALSIWYGGSPALPRNVIQLKTGAPPELELYPLCVQLLKHQVINHRTTQVPSFSGMMGGIGGMVVNSTGLANISTNIVPRRYLAYTAVFSRKHTLRQVYEFLTSRLKINREELRLWKYKDDQNMMLLEDEQKTMIQLGIEDNSQILIEVRNKDLTWPEEMSQIAKNKSAFDKSQQGPTERGATGLSNLGNTCFMNAALQCVSNTQILTHYFRGGMHLYELNRTNPLGMKGHLAQRYGELIKDLWSGNSKCIAPLKFRWTIGRYAPRFNGFQQHDSQELLAFLLDGLHEDLNRVHEKPYVELKDSDGRPDSVVAKEAWDNHLLRNKSIVVDLFHGQLKSTVRCCYCGNTSVRFDPFTFLSLPLPMDSSIHIELQVMWLDGSLPTKYGLRLNVDEKYCQLKKQLSELCGVPAEELLLVELLGASVRSIPDDKQKVKSVVTGGLYAYQLKPPSQCLLTEPIQSGSTLESLAQIQREYRSSPVRRLKLTQESSTNPPIGHHKSSSNDNQPHSQPNGDEWESSKASNCDIKSTHSPHLVNGNCISNQSQQETGQRNDTASNAEVRGQPLGPARSLPAPEAPLSHFIIAVHRKMIRQDLYFLSSQKTCPSLFGIPLILPCDEQTTRLDLYHLVWTQVARLVSPLPPSETANPNHAHDCDDSLGYEYPFTLKAVSKDGMTCAWCPWYRFCRGCKLECDQELFAFGTDHIAIDWEPTALHLRYQSSQEQVFEEHSSVIESRKKQTEPISLDSCLQAFTKEEELGDQELYYCSKCKEHRQAIKKLEIWKLPPILIIHLKRFQFHNGRWIKSHKIVNIPKKNFDPSSYVVPRLKTTDDYNDGLVDEEDEEPENTDETEPSGRQSKRHLSTSSETDYTTVKYDLFAMSCHIGILGGGHYVAYARNPNKKWYCYNDSSCKEVSEDQIDTNSAYILFYERQTLNQGRFMPDIHGKEPDVAEIDDVADSDLRKMCAIQ